MTTLLDPGCVFVFRPGNFTQCDYSNNEFCGLRLMVRVEVLGSINPRPSHNPNRTITLT